VGANDDHLCLVAGISKLQINELKQRGIVTVQNLADMPLPLTWKGTNASRSAGDDVAFGNEREVWRC
jgi:predicted RecB family nuclease